MGDVNYSGGKRPGRNFNLDKSGAPTQSGPFVGEVMSTVDPARQGRIRVWIRTFGDENTKDDESSWFTVRYMSPFYGVTPHKTLDAAGTNFEENGHSYGMWFNVPDVGVEVLVVFAEGDPNQGYYIGCIPTPQMSHMVPAIGAQENPHYNNSEQETKCGGAPRVPVVEMDKGVASMKDANYTDIPKPVHSVLAGQMWKAGTLTDPVRGPIGSSSQRESPSRVYGVNTPGRPIYSVGMFDHDVQQKVESGEETDTSIVGRKGGHSFVMDDGDISGNDNLIRIRTSLGHQITMSDDGDAIYVAHANGNAWVELGGEGTLDGYAANSINLRSGGDINLHADKNINLNALENINMYALKKLVAEAEGSMTLTGKQQVTVYSKTKVGIRSDGTIAIDAASSASVGSDGPVVIKGATLSLNDKGTATVKAPKAQTQNTWADSTLDDTKGWVSEPGKFESIVTRAPTHEPYDAHNTGVAGVKSFEVSVIQAASEPPPPPSVTSAKTADLAAAPADNPVVVEEVITEAIKDGNVGDVGTLAPVQVTGVLASVAKGVDQPADVVSEKGVGTYGLSKQNLEDAGIMKTGIGASDDPAELATVLSDPSVFTGKHGIGSISDLTSNEALQSQVAQDTMNSSVEKFTQAGVLSGNESSADYAGVTALAMSYDTETVKAWSTGTLDLTTTAEMDAIAKSSQYTVTLVDSKAGSVLDNVQSGLGGAAISVPIPATGTIETGNLNSELDKFVGSNRIPTAVEPAEPESSKGTKTLDKGDYI